VPMSSTGDVSFTTSCASVDIYADVEGCCHPRQFNTGPRWMPSMQLVGCDRLALCRTFVERLNARDGTIST
jgi:hypothetical protein